MDEEEGIEDVDFPEGGDGDEDDEALKYVVGYIGRKLGYRQSSTPNPSSWVSIKGKGYMFEPSRDLINICKGCNVIFNQFHGMELNFCVNPLKKVEELILDKNPTYPPRVVKLFCKIKFFHRIKKLNASLKEKKGSTSVRSLKQTAQFFF